MSYMFLSFNPYSNPVRQVLCFKPLSFYKWGNRDSGSLTAQRHTAGKSQQLELESMCLCS